MTHAPAFQHITVPVDGSTTAERGVAFALELARGGGVITFCSVVDPLLVCAPVGGGVVVDPTPLLTVLEVDAAEFCRNAQGEAVREGIESDIQVLHGRCAETIEALARRNGTQAIVIGTHGRTGLARMVLGSVAEELIRCSDVPVVAVHEDDVMRTGPIAVALDESPAAHAALEVAIRIGTTRGIPLLLVHAHDARRDDRDRASELLDGAAKRVRVLGADVKTVVREGHAHDALLKTVDELECCMIVLGTHGRPFFDRLVLGSVAAHVVEHARVPVVTVRRTQARNSRRGDRIKDASGEVSPPEECRADCRSSTFRVVNSQRMSARDRTSSATACSEGFGPPTTSSSARPYAATTARFDTNSSLNAGP